MQVAAATRHDDELDVLSAWEGVLALQNGPSHTCRERCILPQPTSYDGLSPSEVVRFLHLANGCEPIVPRDKPAVDTLCLRK